MQIAKQILTAFLTVYLFCSFSIKESSTLTVHITSLRNNKGQVLVSVYNNADKFGKDAAKYAIGKGKAAISNGTATVSFKDLPAGKYGVAILHDENADQQMNFNLVGMPKEGFGFSNNAKGVFGPPSFTKAAFEVTERQTSITIKMTYFL